MIKFFQFFSKELNNLKQWAINCLLFDADFDAENIEQGLAMAFLIIQDLSLKILPHLPSANDAPEHRKSSFHFPQPALIL